MKAAFQKMTGVPDAWYNPMLMQSRNGFIAGWNAALSQEPVAWMDADGNISDNNDYNCFPIPLYTKTNDPS